MSNAAFDRLRASVADRVSDANLTLLADVVRYVVEAERVPLNDAAKCVLDELDIDPAALFIRRDRDCPLELDQDGPRAATSLRRPGRRAGRDIASGAYSFHPGRVGWLELLRLLWLGCVAPPGMAQEKFLTFDKGGYVAIRRSDAVRLFGYTESNGTADVRQLHALPVSAEKMSNDDAAVLALRNRIEAHVAVKKSGSHWPGGARTVYAALLEQYEERMRLPDAESSTAEEKIAELWQLGQNTVHNYLTKARKQRQADATATAAPKRA